MIDNPLPIWAAAERNKQPIAHELCRLFARPGLLLEIGSATGQHASHFCEQLPHLQIQPSDYDAEHLETLRKRVALGQWPRLLPPLQIDVCETPWPIAAADYVFSANMMHIAPWAASVGLFRGCSTILAAGGLLVTYGPYKLGGQHTAASNESFDLSLRARNADWGVREVNDLVALGAPLGLELVERLSLPANNQMLVFKKR